MLISINRVPSEFWVSCMSTFWPSISSINRSKADWSSWDSVSLPLFLSVMAKSLLNLLVHYWTVSAYPLAQLRGLSVKFGQQVSLSVNLSLLVSLSVNLGSAGHPLRESWSVGQPLGESLSVGSFPLLLNVLCFSFCERLEWSWSPSWIFRILNWIFRER